jgi:hypothetical protein
VRLKAGGERSASSRMATVKEDPEVAELRARNAELSNSFATCKQQFERELEVALNAAADFIAG